MNTVLTFDLLPDPSTVVGEFYKVTETSEHGYKGIYKSTGIEWAFGAEQSDVLNQRVSKSEKDIDALTISVAGKQDAGDYAEEEHGHAISDVTGLQDALDGKASSSHTHAQSDITGLVSALSAITGRLDTLEGWKTLMGAKRQDVYTGTTDANGDVTFTFPSGRYSSVPFIKVNYIFNNNNYSSSYNVKALTTTTASLRIHRNKNTTVGALGGDVDPDEPLASTAITLIASEF